MLKDQYKQYEFEEKPGLLKELSSSVAYKSALGDLYSSIET